MAAKILKNNSVNYQVVYGQLSGKSAPQMGFGLDDEDEDDDEFDKVEEYFNDLFFNEVDYDA